MERFLMSRHPSDHNELSRGGIGLKCRGRLLASWLLLGWVAFFLNTTAQACCTGFAPKVSFGGEAVQAYWPADDSSLSDHPVEPLSSCPDFMVPTVVAIDVAATTDRPDSRGAAIVEPWDRVMARPAHAATTQQRLRSVSPPHFPLYLRTARLLI